jgi:hypothetical protein
MPEVSIADFNSSDFAVIVSDMVFPLRVLMSIESEITI